MKHHISVICTEEDFRAGDYMSITNCALGRAIRRAKLPLISVGGHEVFLKDGVYAILEANELAIAHDYPKDLQVNLLLI